MLRLVHVLFGVQPKATRQMPYLPTQWQEVSFSEAVTDSREVVADALFVALSGERTDGHNYLTDVAARGARGALVKREEVECRRADLAHLVRHWVLLDPAEAQDIEAQPLDSFLLITVDDPLMALQRLAVYHRRQLTLPVVAITGSVGKTSTKEVVAAVLRQRFRTLKNKRSFNSEATLPITMLQLNHDYEVAVLEMGMWATGEIRFLANLARPTIGIVTNVGPSHCERLGSIEAIARAKSELIESLPANGVAILNADDPYVTAMANLTKARIVRYGLSATADVWADEIESFGLNGIAFRVHYGTESCSVRVPMIGRHSVAIALPAIAVGLVMGMAMEAILAGLHDPAARLRLMVVPAVHGAILIDDTYNAAPLSVLAALELLGELPGRPIAVLGDMLELGVFEEAAHRQVGQRVATVAQLLVCVGRRARWIAETARAAGMAAAQVLVFDENHAAALALRQLLQAGDYVLIKGSRGMAMEQLVAALQHTREEEG